MFQMSRSELVSRNSDIKIMISELPKMKVDCSAILKSSILVMTYNMMEGVFYTILQESFDKVTQCENINNCSDDFLLIVTDYYFGIIENDLRQLVKHNEKQKSKQPKLEFIKYKQSIDNHKNIVSLRNNLEKLQIFNKNNIKYIPEFSEYINNIKLFSGNLDENEIRKIAKRFGVSFEGKSSDFYLELVKEKRNKLAHGEAKYSMECRDMSDTDIKKAQKAVFNYMIRVIKAFYL